MAQREKNDQSLQTLKRALKEKNPGRLYVFHGEENFLLNYYLERIKTLLLDPLTESFNYHRFHNENYETAQLMEAVENLPMMAEYTLIQVDDIDLFKLPEDERDKIAETLRDIPDYCTVIFTYMTVAWKPDKRMKKLWDAVDGSGLIVDFAKQDTPELVAWITRHFAANQKKIDSGLCQYLIEITGGTMTAIKGEIDKICAYSGSDKICKADIDAVVEPVLDAVVFQMTDMISEGAYDQALQKLQQLLKMQQEPLMILGAIGAQFRRLGAARTLLDHGKGTYELQTICGLRDFVARKTMESARRVRPDFCEKALQWIMETDYQIKTTFDDSERLLEMLILKLAAEARNG